MKSAPPPPHEARRLEALRRTALLDTPPAPEFDDATQLASYIFGAPIALISLVDEKRQWFKSRIGIEATETPREIAFCAHAILGEEIFIVPDAQNDERFADNPLVLSAPYVRFYAGAPLVTEDGDALGTICVVDHEPRQITDDQRQALAALARQVMAQVRLAMRTAEVARRNREMNDVNEFGDLLQSCLSIDEANEVIGIHLRKLFPCGRGAVCVTNSSHSLVETMVSWGDNISTDLVFAPDDCWALRRGRPHIVRSRGDGPVCRHAHFEAGGHACIPMMAQGEIHGILHLTEDADRQNFESQLQLASATAGRIALALANLRLRDRLREQSVRDSLTGLFNRRYLEETLEREVRRSQRHGLPLTMAVIDVDHFKQYNDAHGHDAGDAVLCALAAHLRSHVRTEDIVCRYGGEEFVVVFSNGESEPCAERAQRLCRAARELTLRWQERPLAPISISVGVASLGRHVRSAADLFHAADNALYRAKEEGRDRVVVAQEADEMDAAERLDPDNRKVDNDSGVKSRATGSADSLPDTTSDSSAPPLAGLTFRR